MTSPGVPCTLSWYSKTFRPLPRRWWHKLLRVQPGTWGWAYIALTVSEVSDADGEALVRVINKFLAHPTTIWTPVGDAVEWAFPKSEAGLRGAQLERGPTVLPAGMESAPTNLLWSGKYESP